MKNIVKLLEASGHKDLAAIVMSQVENGEMPMHNSGRIDTPRASQPNMDEQVSVSEDTYVDNSIKEEEEQKNLYTVNVNCTMSFDIEVQAKDENDALNTSPTYAMDTIDEIKDTLNKNFRSFNISFNKIIAKEAKEVIVEED